MQPNRSSFWCTTVRFVAGPWRAWRERRLDLVRLGRVDATEVSGIAKDLNVSTAELRSLAGLGKNSAALLDRRLHTLGIDPAKVEPAVMRDLQRCCSQCQDKALCAHELEDKPKQPSWPHYCPNEQTIGALQTERHIDR